MNNNTLKLPIPIQRTEFVELDVPCYYRPQHLNKVVKIMHDKIISVCNDYIAIHTFKQGSKLDQSYYDDIRDYLQYGTPLTKEEFEEEFTKAVNHISIHAL